MMWSILIYVGIFVAKLVEVTLATIRNVLINRGEKVKGALLGFFEVLIWIIVVSNVLDTISEDPFKVVVYCLAFACGNYLGVILEGKLAIGTACIQAVVDSEQKEELGTKLRDRGFGVTTLQGRGMQRTVDVLMIYLRRKDVPEASSIINEYVPEAMIVVNDVRQMRSGFMRK